MVKIVNGSENHKSWDCNMDCTFYFLEKYDTHTHAPIKMT